MRKYQKGLLAGVAALALIAGTGFASAQGQPQGPQGQSATPQSAAPPQSTAPKAGETHAAQPSQHSGMQAQSPSGAGMNAQTGKKGQSAQNEGVNAQTGNKGPSAQNENGMQPNGKGATGQTQRNAQGSTGNAQGTAGQMQGSNRTEETPQGTAQNSGAGGQVQGGNVRLSGEQRTRVRKTIINARNAPRANHVNFSLNVGTAIPREEIRTIHVVPVPEYLVRIEPRWHGLKYFIFQDEVVIVNPRDMRIIAILPV